MEPPTLRQGARRVWSDSRGRIWVSEWNSGNLSMHDPALGTGANSWRTWKAPGAESHVYAVYVDDKDIVWASEWSNNAMLRFDPRTEKFEVLAMPRYRRQHPPDTGPAWGGLAAGKRDGVYFSDPDSVNAAKIAQTMFGGPAASGWHTAQGRGPGVV
ncbi:hypothetical protein LP414_26820 [Polaromonas sp. P1(28)-13]|nr:hypothetical protein LP414_26820 [Polaromonas sp. P1(28)-13]